MTKVCLRWVRNTIRFRQILTILATISITVVACATTRIRQPTAAELSTVWVSWVDSVGYYRLQMTEDGKGLCSVYERYRADSRLYEISKWTLKGYDIEITLKPIDLDAEMITLKGSANPGSLRL